MMPFGLHGHDPEEMSGNLKEVEEKYKALRNRIKTLRSREPGNSLAGEWEASGALKALDSKQREILDKFDFETGLPKETKTTSLTKSTNKSQHDGAERMFYPGVCSHFRFGEDAVETVSKHEAYTGMKYVRMVPRSC
jgi:hypothetical protein